MFYIYLYIYSFKSTLIALFTKITYIFTLYKFYSQYITLSFLLFFFFNNFSSIPILKSRPNKVGKKPVDIVHKKWWFDMKKLFFN